MVEQPKWEWIDTVFGLIVGAVTAIAGMLGWISPKLTKIDEKMDKKVEELHARVTPLSEELAALQAHHDNDRELLRAINVKLESLEQFLRHGRSGRMP